MRTLGRKSTEVYSDGTAAASAAVGALRNRNVADPLAGVLSAFTATTTPSVLAAIVFTPKVSGVIQLSAMFDFINNSATDDFVMVAEIVTGTALTVTGGDFTSNGWVEGGGTPPVVGGSGLVASQTLGEVLNNVPLNKGGSLTTFGISQPLPVGVPVVVQIIFQTQASTANLASLAFSGLSVLELP